MAIRRLAIDLGTSKITVCFYKNKKVEEYQIGGLNMDYPSCIYYNNQVLFGEEALNKGKDKPRYCFRHLKTLIGRSYDDQYVQSIKNHVSYKIVRGKDGRVMVEVFDNNQTVHKDPTDLLSMLVNHVIDYVKEKTGSHNIDYVAFAFPPSFTERQKVELKRIAIGTGIRHIVLYPETTAACICYGIQSMNVGETALVVDCGAGTCDATVLKYDNGFEVVSHTGYNDIGGVNYTQLLMDYALKRFEENGCPMEKMIKKKKALLEQIAEDTKIVLGNYETVPMDMTDDYFPEISITQTTFAGLCSELDNKICDMIKSLNCHPTYVLLSGKGLLLRSLVTRIRQTVSKEIAVKNTDNAVARGLALYIGTMEPHSDDDGCNQIVLCDNDYIDHLISDNGLTNCLSASSLEMTEEKNQQLDSHVSSLEEENEEEDDGVASILQEAHFDSIQEFRISKDNIPPFIFNSGSCMNESSFGIKEKRTYDISIGVRPKTNTNRAVIIGRDRELPCEKSYQLYLIQGKQPQVTLYEGNSPLKEKNTPIQHVVLERDAEHPDDKKYKFEITVKVDKEGFVTTSFNWVEDNGEKKPMRIISDNVLKSSIVVFAICFR